MNARSRVAPILAVAATAVGVSGASAQYDVCTLIGCESAVTLQPRAYVRAHPAVRTLTLGALGRCTKSPARTELVRLRVPAGAAETVVVKVVARDRRGRIRLRRTLRVTLHRLQPNGPRCEPTCFVAHVRLDRRGRLREATPV